MAIKTFIAREAMEGIIAEYDLGNLLSVEGLSAGAVQTNYRLNTDRTTLVFRLYENRNFEQVMYEIELLTHLSDRGFPCPIPYANRRSERAGMYAGKPYALFSFMPGAHVEAPNAAQRRALIRAVARMNSLVKGFSSRYAAARQNYNPEFCRAYATRRAAELGAPDRDEKLRWYLCALDALSLPDDLPLAACHCDFHFSNALFEGDRLTALIDFDDANHTYAIFDLIWLIDPFRSAFRWDTWRDFQPHDSVLDFTDARSIAAEYQAHRALSEIERLHAFDVFKLSVLIDALWYFQRDGVDCYEKRKLDALDALGRERFTREMGF